MFSSHSEIELLASASRTATVNTADTRSDGARGLVMLLDVTAASLTPSVVFTIQGKIGDKYYTLLASAAVTGITTNTYIVYPGLTAAANLVASNVLPESFRVNCVHADTDPITYSIKVCLIP